VSAKSNANRLCGRALRTRRSVIGKFKLALIGLAAALGGAAALAAQPAARADEQAQQPFSIEAIDDFLADSRRHLGL